MRILKIFTGILTAIILGLLFAINIYPRYYFVGISKNGTDIAKRLIESRSDVDECLRIVRFDPFDSPSQESQKNLCIYSYAELTKDPSACELLMPSSYGLSCVGAAEDSAPCVMLVDSQKSVGGEGIDTTYDRCMSGPENTQNHVCCVMAKVQYGQEHSCAQFPAGPLNDQCHHILAVKQKDLSGCDSIENERNRTGCQVVVRAYLNGLRP